MAANLAIADNDTVIQYTSVGESIFTFPFPFLDNAEIKVSVDQADQVLGADFTLTGLGDAGGGTVTFIVATTIGEIITIWQDMDFKRLTGFSTGAATILGEDLNTEFARQVRHDQQVRRDIRRALRLPVDDSISGTDMELAPVATRKGKFLRFADATGAPEYVDVTASTTILSQSVLEGFLDPQTAAELSAGVTPIRNVGTHPILDMRRFSSVIGTGVDITGAVAQAILAGYRTILLRGHNLLNALAISVDDMTFMGEGESTRLTVLNNNSRLFTVTGQRFKLLGMRVEGDTTSSSSSNGNAVLLTDAGEAVFEDVFFDGFGFSGVTGFAASAFKGPAFIRPKFRNTAAAGNEIYLGGLWRDIVVEDVDAVSANIADRVVTAFNNATAGWEGLTVRGGNCQGYQKQAISGSDEDPNAASKRVWTMLVDGVRFKDMNWSAVKAKNVLNVKVIDITCEDCSKAAEDLSSGLYGDVLCNSIGQVLVAQSTFRNSGTDAIHLIGQQNIGTGLLPDGTGRFQYKAIGNDIDGTGAVAGTGNGVAIVGGVSQAIVAENSFKGVRRSIIDINAQAGGDTRPVWDVGIFNNAMNRNPGATNGIAVSYASILRLDGNVNQDGSATGALIKNCGTVLVGPTDSVMDPAVAGGRGYQFSDCDTVRCFATAGNTEYAAHVVSTAYALGARIRNGANVYEATVAGTTGAASPPTHTSGVVVDGTVSWNFVHKYKLMPFGVRWTGTFVDADFDMHFKNLVTRPMEGLVPNVSGAFVLFAQTTDATSANETIALPDECAFRIRMETTSKKSDSSDRAMYHRAALFFRDGGATTLQGAVQDAETPVESNAAWNANFFASGNNAVISLTGVAATTVDWRSKITFECI